jgi:uncharacterized protein YbaA (DUF1428 family)
VRDNGMKGLMADPHMQPDSNPMSFNGSAEPLAASYRSSKSER